MPQSAQDPQDCPLPPGSMGLPFLGEALALAGDNRRFFLKRYQKHGPVFKTRIAGNPVICFVGPEGMGFLQDRDYFDRVAANGPPTSALLRADTSPLLSGDRHALRKQLILQALDDKAIDKYIPMLERIVDRWIERWELIVEFRWLDEFQHMTLGLINALFLGDTGSPRETDAGDAETDDRDFEYKMPESRYRGGSRTPALQQMMDGFVKGFSTLPAPINPVYLRAQHSRNSLLATIDKAIGLHRRELGKFLNITSELIDARYQYQTENGDAAEASLSDIEIRNEILHMFFAAYSGLSLTLTALCLALGQHRAIMQKARREVLDKCPEGPLDMEKLSQLEYLQWLTTEARRFNPVIAMTFFSRIRKTCVYQGYRLPKDWLAVGGIYATMHNSQTFVDPGVFDPERFSAERSRGRAPNSFCAHGAGPLDGHKCGGELFADVLLKVATVHLLRRCTWTLPPQKLNYTKGGLFPQPRDRLKVHFRRLLQP